MNSSEVNLIINGKDARSEWGVVTTTNTLSTLLAPAPMKEYPAFNSRLEHGTRTDTSAPRLAQRDLNLEIQMTAKSPEDFYRQLAGLTAELQKGSFTLQTTDRTGTVYRLVYVSCSSFTQFRRGIAILSLKVSEPDPSDRTPKR